MTIHKKMFLDNPSLCHEFTGHDTKNLGEESNIRLPFRSPKL